jgi:hypothetical protein
LNGETDRVRKSHKSAIIAVDVRRFAHAINTDQVFGTHKAGPARLRITKGKLRLGSLGGPGFAVAGEMDFASMRPMPDAPKSAIVRRERDAVGGASGY